ncbi:hypothetical protein SAMN02983003_3330 [Devosia enhydra]|uniref:WGR domain-containing protein n=1 Tax=Devosia enhydra TaxID=665118 RepID=A0A1K2I313_9HYPH|nr:hypothetical protein [Devosia enhydra]SFZ86156.1 hypothetical protein SAMN02983003_3330 [Devosia enhydra]
MTEAAKLDIRLRRTGGSGPNAQWVWEVYDQGALLKKGTTVGDEAKAFATARKAGEKARG